MHRQVVFWQICYMSSSLGILGLNASLWALAIGCAQPIAADSRGWTTIEDARLVIGSHSDGDSVQVCFNGKSYVFRLYGVDTPETKTSAMRRLASQAEYFNVPPREAYLLRAIGQRASAFTRQQLARSFVVRTRWQRVDPGSDNPSIRAFIETPEGDLGELLVAAGLAAIRGGSAMVQHPDGRSIGQQTQRLKNLERAAKQKKLGAWALATQRTGTSAAALLVQAPDPSQDVVAATDTETIRCLVGSVVTVRGRIDNVGATPSGSIHFLNFEGTRRGEFVAIVRADFLDRVERALEGGLSGLAGKEVLIYGPLTSYRDIPQIELTEPSQLRLADHAVKDTE